LHYTGDGLVYGLRQDHQPALPVPAGYAVENRCNFKHLPLAILDNFAHTPLLVGGLNERFLE
jgi:hypothetical protein